MNYNFYISCSNRYINLKLIVIFYYLFFTLAIPMFRYIKVSFQIIRLIIKLSFIFVIYSIYYSTSSNKSLYFIIYSVIFFEHYNNSFKSALEGRDGSVWSLRESWAWVANTFFVFVAMPYHLMG
jgi:hypothetical protein